MFMYLNENHHKKKKTLHKLRSQSTNLYYLIFFGKENMYWLWAIAFMVALRGSATKETILGTAKLEHYWAEAFKVMIHVHIPYPVSNGWRIALLFSITIPIKTNKKYQLVARKSYSDIR